MVLISTHNLCFEQKYEKNIRIFLSENFQFLEVKVFIYLNRRVFEMGLSVNPHMSQIKCNSGKQPIKIVQTL